MTVPIQAEPQDGPSALCFEADVFYGATKQDAGRVSVSSEFAQSSQSGSVFVSANVRVDEPVVTVYLRAGCEHKSTRRYVLLADLTSETAQAVGEVREPVRPAMPVVVVAPLVTPPVPVAESVTPDKPSKPAKKPVVERSVRVPAKVALPPPAVKPPPVRRAHLKLAPLDLTVERDTRLKLSKTMQVSEDEDLQKRAEAVALWRALNASPQDILNADQRRQSMEADLKGLQAMTAKNRDTLQMLTSRLERAESERYINPLVYGLLAVLLLCSAGVVYAWLRMRQAGPSAVPWWRHDDPATEAKSEWVGEAHAETPVRVADAWPTVPSDSGTSEAAAVLTAVDIDLHLDEPHHLVPEPAVPKRAPDVVPAAPAIAASRAAGHADFAHSMSASLRALNTQEMLDVRQQAEFFMTLGQHEDAIETLKDSIERSADSNPLVYLDLLRVLHTLGRKTEYDQYRADFNALFSGQVPLYSEFNQPREGLEAYPDVCRRICELWPSQEALDCMEACMVRTQGDDPAQGFTLEAFRDLLMLHSVAQRMVSDSETGLQPFSAARGMESTETETQPIAPHMPTSDAFSVDLELSEPPSGNLIDFDAADLGSFKPPARKPE
ncbi:MAG: hypothetical protein HYX43_21115 [Burkholderiales bacterium]|nr:hypothetical protein [Burkholderiales bacterium]